MEYENEFNIDNYGVLELNKRTLTFREIVGLQDYLNEKTLENWKFLLSEDHFKTQAMFELCELVDSGVRYKWWKDSKDLDWYNIKLEAIDIIHFLVSARIISNLNDNAPPLDKDYISMLDKFLPYDHIRCIEQSISFVNYDNTLDFHNFIKLQRKLLDGDYMRVFCSVICCAKLTSEEISAYYIAKNELNRFRQMNGYADGSYTRYRKGLTDNEVMENSITDFLNNNRLKLCDLKLNVVESLEEWIGEGD